MDPNMPPVGPWRPERECLEEVIEELKSMVEYASEELDENNLRALKASADCIINQANDLKDMVFEMILEQRFGMVVKVPDGKLPGKIDATNS